MPYIKVVSLLGGCFKAYNFRLVVVLYGCGVDNHTGAFHTGCLVMQPLFSYVQRQIGCFTERLSCCNSVMVL